MRALRWFIYISLSVLLVASALFAWLGLSSWFQGRQQINAAWQRCSTNSKSLRQCINNFHRTHQDKMLEAIARRALKDFPLTIEERSFVWHQLAEVYKRTNRPHRAEKAFRQTIALLQAEELLPAEKNRLFSSFYQLCMVLAWNAQFQRARDCFAEALQRFPKSRRLQHGREEFAAYAEQRESHGPARVILRFAGNNRSSEPLYIRGSWNQQGEHRAVEGWQPVAMHRVSGETDHAVWQTTVTLQPNTPLPYAAVVVERQEDNSSRIRGIRLFRLTSSALLDIEIPAHRSRPIEFQSQQERPAADGKRRVFVLWPDSATWLHLMALVHSGEAPHTARLMQQGVYGIMDSQPPITSIATEKLTYLGDVDRGISGVIATMLRQIKGVPFFDRFVSMRWIHYLSAEGRIDLWTYLAKNNTSSINLILSDIWCNARDRGTQPVLSDLGIAKTAEYVRRFASSEEEKHFFASLFPKGYVAKKGRQTFLQHAWRQMRARRELAVDAWNTGEFDFLLLRYAMFDVIHHYDSLLAGEVGVYLYSLQAFYRFLDDSIATLQQHVDADDTFLLISDHGARDMLTHHRDAIFIAAGGGIPVKGYIGKADIAVFPGLILDLFGIEDPPGKRIMRWPGFQPLSP